MSNYKMCCVCKTKQLKNNFSKSRTSKDGFKGRCKSCDSASNKKYRQNNHKKEIQRKREWRKNNPEKVKESNDNYRKDPENLKKLYAYDAKYRAENKDHIYAKQKEWHENNPDKVREKTRKRRALKAKLKENYTIKCETITYKAFNNRCFNCKLYSNLCIDHHRPLSKGNPLTLNNAVVLCKSCNSSKGDQDPKEFYGIKKYKRLENKLNKICE